VLSPTLDELTEQMHRFVSEQGWYAADSPKPQTIRNLAASLAIEAGEVLEHVQWTDRPNDQEGWAEELADVQLYLLQLASLSGVALDEAVLAKLEKNRGRTW
jgi:NTP pyrophosphatase (non-canonical NTP hydrolase)